MAAWTSVAVRDPILVGGTGRSGTTIVGELIGQHPDYFAPPFETRFHIHGTRLLMRGAIEWDEFEEKLRNEWFHTNHRPVEAGIGQLVEDDTFEVLLSAFRNSYEARPWDATRRFVRGLMDPLAAEAGARSWVDTTPSNCVYPEWAGRVFGNSRFVHVVRNGLDVACSVVTMPWGPDDLDGGVEWWARRLRAAAGRLSDGIDPQRVLTLQMEDLVLRRRDETLAELLSFLGLDETEDIRRFFEEVVSPASVGRWRADLPPESRDAFVQRYEALRDELEQELGDVAPAADAHLLTA